MGTGTRPATVISKEEILDIMVQDMELGPKKTTTSSYSMLEKVLIKLEEVNLCLIPALLPPIIQVIMVDYLVFIITMITEVGIGITPANFLHINMVE